MRVENSKTFPESLVTDAITSTNRDLDRYLADAIGAFFGPSYKLISAGLHRLDAKVPDRIKWDVFIVFQPTIVPVVYEYVKCRSQVQQVLFVASLSIGSDVFFFSPNM